MRYTADLSSGGNWDDQPDEWCVIDEDEGLFGSIIIFDLTESQAKETAFKMNKEIQMTKLEKLKSTLGAADAAWDASYDAWDAARDAAYALDADVTYALDVAYDAYEAADDAYQAELRKQRRILMPKLEELSNAQARILEVPDTADFRMAELEAADPTPDEGLIEVGKLLKDATVNAADVTLDTLNFPNIDRVEVINAKGRVYSDYHATDVRISIQDQGQTLKVFLLNDAWKVEEPNES